MSRYKEVKMIIVDGRQSDKKLSAFANLEDVLTDVMEDDSMSGRIITDVLVNDESFSEIYPHQAEDMDCDAISKLEVRSAPALTLAVEMSGELDKVARMMASGGNNVGRLFREGKDSDALELIQDLLEVTRDFMGILAHLRDRYLGGADEEFVGKVSSFSDLISEMSEVLESEDWILLADLLEYEFVPACEDWRVVSNTLHSQLSSAAGN